MTLITPESADVLGITPTFVAADAAGNEIERPAGAVLIFRNDDAAAKTVTIDVPGQHYGQALPDVPVTIQPGEVHVTRPLPADLFDPADGLAHITYSAVTSLTVAAIRINA